MIRVALGSIAAQACDRDDVAVDPITLRPLTRTLLALTAVVLALSLVGSDVAGAGAPASDGGTVFGAGLEPVGCTSTPGREAREGPRSRREVALTFDDGPSSVQTPEILATLESL